MSTEGYQIAVKSRSEFGKNASRRARKDGLIPAIVYSKGKKGEAIFIDASEWAAISNHALNLIHLIDGDVNKAALIKEIQFNYLKNYVVHIDFQEVDMNEEIRSEIAIRAIGDCAGANHGGILEQEIHMLEVVCKAQDLPESISVDVSKLEVGEAICLRDVELPQGVRTELDPEDIVFHVIRPQQEEEPAPAEAAAEGGPEVITAKKSDADDAEEKK